MRIVTSAIKDSILAAGLTFNTHDEHGELIGASQVNFLEVAPTAASMILRRGVDEHPRSSFSLLKYKPCSFPCSRR